MKILVAGDAMLDRYWFGEVSRICPEAPVPVVAIERAEEREGGAANVARNIEAMGLPTVRLYSDSYAADPVVKLRIIGRSQQMVRVDFDRPQAPIDPQAFEGALEDCGLVVFSDYGKGALAGIERLIERCDGRTVLVDPKGHRYERYAGADLVKPNLAELWELAGGWERESELDAKVDVLRDKGRIGAVLLTRGARGMTLYNGVKTNFPAEAREVYDVSGAGDTAIAALAAGLALGYPLAEAASYANRAAGVAVSRFGTTVVRREEVFG